MKFDVDPSVRDEACPLADTKKQNAASVGKQRRAGCDGKFGNYRRRDPPENLRD